MIFTEFAELSESRQNPKVVWLPETLFPMFPSLSLRWYLFTVVSHNRYLTRGSSGNAHSITTNGNVSVAT